MELLFLYIRSRRNTLGGFLLFSLIYSLSVLLYRLPLEAVLYPFLLCCFLGLIFLGLDFSRIWKKHRRLTALTRQTASLLSSLPSVESVEDQDYQAIIQVLQGDLEELETHAGLRYRDMIDYYTLWVHQIKTPIASMRLNLQAEDTALSRKLSSDLFRIEQYVEMVLAFLRLDSPSSDYVFREHSIDTLVRRTVKKFASEFILRKISLDYEPIAETVITDEKWLSFVLEQVLSNALKYSREGGTVKIRLTAPKTLTISDTGIGIAPEDLPRIFEKGYTGCNGRTDARASGIGLYLCKRICQNLGVGISAVSQPDHGATIRLNLEQYDLKAE